MGAAESRIACAIWLLAGSPALAAQPPDGFNLNEVKPGVFVHLGRQLPLDVPGHDDIANIGFIAGGKCVAIIDSGIDGTHPAFQDASLQPPAGYPSPRKYPSPPGSE